MSSDTKNLVKISKALADETRYRIFKMIAQKGEIPCKDIVEVFHVSQPTISHHLKVLMESGLVQARKEGQWTYFSIDRSAWEMYVTTINRDIRG